MIGLPVRIQAQSAQTLIPVIGTTVRAIHPVIPVNIRRGPGVAYSSIGVLRVGQTARVTGISLNRLWWRITCPDGSTGNCFVAANRRYTQTGVAPTLPPSSTLPVSYTRNLQKWQSKEIAHYQVQIQRICFCVPAATKPIMVEVSAGRVTRMNYADGSAISAESADYFTEFNTIEKMFALIANGIRQHYDQVEVIYDASYGFPSSATLDPRRIAAADEAFYSISNLRIIR